MTSLRQVQPYLPLSPKHEAGGRRKSTESCVQHHCGCCPQSRTDGAAYGCTCRRKQDSHLQAASSAAQSRSPHAAHSVLPLRQRKLEKKCSAVLKSKDQIPVTSAMPVIVEQTDCTRAMRKEKRPSVEDCDNPEHMCSKREISLAQNMADSPDLTSRVADQSSPMGDGFTVKSSDLDCDIATKAARLSGVKSHSFDLHDEGSKTRSSLRKAESSPEMAQPAVDALSPAVCAHCRYAKCRSSTLRTSSLDLTDDASTEQDSSLLTASVYTSKQGWLQKHKTAGSRQTVSFVEPSGQSMCCIDSCCECVTAEEEGACGCVCSGDSSNYVGMDIPMTNLGLTSAELMLLF